MSVNVALRRLVQQRSGTEPSESRLSVSRAPTNSVVSDTPPTKSFTTLRTSNGTPDT